MSKQLSQKEIALNYAKKGIKIFPCNEEKKPFTKNGFKNATKNLKEIERLWGVYPDALIGAPNDQFIVVDLDGYDLCPLGQMAFDKAVEELYGRGILKKDEGFRVRTLKGGEHIYFAKDKRYNRRLSCLPAIDICANNGYNILADQKKYIANVDDPWNHVLTQPKIDVRAMEQLIWELEELTTSAKPIIKASKAAAKVKRERAEYVDTPDEGQRYDFDPHGNVKFKQEGREKTYARSDRDYKASEGYIAPTAKVLNENGKIRIERRQIKDSDFLMSLFHNREVQLKLAEHMGLTVPSIGDQRVLGRSIFDGHIDKNPSMGVRWRCDGGALIIRDFANYYGDVKQNLDFNLVRLWTARRLKSLTPRHKPKEFLMFFLCMMYEAGMLDIDELQYSEDLPKVDGKNADVAEGLRRLASFNLLFDDADGFVIMTQVFGAIFCGVSASTVKNAKRVLQDQGYINLHGHMKTVKTSKTHFYATSVMSLNEARTDEGTNLPKYLTEVDERIHAEAAAEYCEYGREVEAHREEGRKAREEIRAKKRAEREAAKALEAEEEAKKSPVAPVQEEVVEVEVPTNKKYVYGDKPTKEEIAMARGLLGLEKKKKKKTQCVDYHSKPVAKAEKPMPMDNSELRAKLDKLRPYVCKISDEELAREKVYSDPNIPDECKDAMMEIELDNIKNAAEYEHNYITREEREREEFARRQEIRELGDAVTIECEQREEHEYHIQLLAEQIQEEMRQEDTGEHHGHF